MAPSAPPHIRLLNLLGAIRDLAPFDLMTAEEDQLLRNLLVRWHDAKDITVSDIMKSMADVSHATAYRRLMALRDKGMVRLRLDDTDKRVKLVEPTQLASDYAKHIHTALEQVTEANRAT